MNAPLDQRTTLASVNALSAWQNTTRPASNLLYFHITLTAAGESFDEESRRLSFERRIFLYLEAFDCQTESVTVINNHFHLLIGLEKDCSLPNLVQKLKIVSRSFARRRLRAEKFNWREEYEAATVSFSQLKYVRRNLRRQQREVFKNGNLFWQRILIGSTC